MVVGATALGVTAAISAADAGIPVTLIEQEPVLFPSIHLTREILGPSPEEWPYTTSLPRFPLSTETGEGKDIAVVWTNQIGQFIKRNHLLAVSCSRRVSAMEFIPRSSHPYGVDAVRVSFDREGTDLVAGAILWAQDLRWQDEVREIRQGYEGRVIFQGQPSWGPFDLTQVQLRLPSARVLISGGGDMSAEDYIAVTTGMTHVVLARGLGIPQRLMAQLERAAHHADNWLNQTGPEVRFLAALDATCHDLANSALEIDAVSRGLEQIVLPLAAHARLIHRGPLLLTEDWLGRFLISLVSKHVRRMYGHEAVLPNVFIKDIRPAASDPHECIDHRTGWAAGAYSGDLPVDLDCTGRDHEVVLEGSDKLEGRPDGTYNLILVRHGFRGGLIGNLNLRSSTARSFGGPVRRHRRQRPSERPITEVLQPDRSLVLLLGASIWPKMGLAEEPSYRRSARFIQEYVTNSTGLAIPERRILDLFDSLKPTHEQLIEIQDFIATTATADDITDVLIYAISHGDVPRPPNDRLHVVLRDTRRDMVFATGMQVSSLAATLDTVAPKLRRFAIFDCCYSGEVALAFMAPDRSEAVAREMAADFGVARTGTLLFCSSSGDRASYAYPGDEFTLFTGAMAKILKNGLPQGGDAFTFHELREAVGEEVRRAQGPMPQMHVGKRHYDGALDDLRAFPNAVHFAWRGSQTSADPQKEENA
ncbi:MAG: hypothetical protein ABSC06_08550 [Rhodopila sp.]